MLLREAQHYTFKKYMYLTPLSHLKSQLVPRDFSVAGSKMLQA